MPYKVQTMRYLLRMLRTVRTVEVYEDNRNNLAALRKAANTWGYAFEGIVIPHKTTPAACYPSPAKVAARFHE